MLCKKPFVQGGHAYGCGQCLPCRISRRRVWAHRMMLEALQYKENAFVTLTYADEKLPKCNDGTMPSLRPLDVQLWLKRLRRVVPFKFRFFVVGEYGDESWRPHYHLALFGYPSCRYVWSRYSREITNCCGPCDRIRDSWGMGHVYLGQLESESMHYVAGYVLKKMTDPEDKRLLGRHPEFARMSLRPGIGAGMMDDTASQLLFYELEQRLQDVPQALRHGDKELPLGRYLRRRLRERIGREPTEPKEVSIARSKELHALYVANVDNPEKSVAKLVAEIAAPRVGAVENRLAIHRRKRKI